MFLLVFVILSTGGGRCLPEYMLGYHPREQTPPQSRHPPEQTPRRADTPPLCTWSSPPGSRHPPESRLQHTVNDRPIRILLECILVLKIYLCEGKLLQSGGPLSPETITCPCEFLSSKVRQKKKQQKKEGKPQDVPEDIPEKVGFCVF